MNSFDQKKAIEDFNGCNNKKFNNVIAVIFPQYPIQKNKVDKFLDDGQVDSIHSFSDIKRIQNYFISKNKYRDNLMFILGITTGLRISDILSLRIKDVIEDNSFTFRSCIDLYEGKTGKRTRSAEDVVILTEAAQIAINIYLGNQRVGFNREDFLFKSQMPALKGRTSKSKKGERIITEKGDYVITPERACRIMKKAQEDLKIPYKIRTHTLRKTFLNIVLALVSNSNINVNSSSLTMAQIMARHEDVRTTMRYLCKTKRDAVALRNKVSDYVLGRVQPDVLSEELKFYV